MYIKREYIKVSVYFRGIEYNCESGTSLWMSQVEEAEHKQNEISVHLDVCEKEVAA